MAGHVPLAAVVDALDFAPAEREEELDVEGLLGVVGELLMPVDVELFFRNAEDLRVEVPRLVLPVVEPLQRFVFMAEEFHFHLHEFAGAEREVARVDFVAERLARLRDAEGQLLAGGDADRVEIDENRLAGFRAQPRDVLFVEHGADERLHHEVEFARFGQPLGAAVRAGRGVVHLVDAVAAFAVHAVRHEIGELVEMAGGFPDHWMADDGGVQSDDVVTLLDHVFPPELFDGAAEGGAVGAVVPEAVDAAVYFGALEDDAAPFAQGDDFVHLIVFNFAHWMPRCVVYVVKNIEKN